MSETQLVFRVDEFFNRSKSGAIWGTVYFQSADGPAFPDKGWTDLVAAFLRAWLGALVRMARGISSKESVAFYDGPMQVELNIGIGSIVELVFLHRDEPRFTVEGKMLHLLSDSIRVAEVLLRACDERNWHNADTAAVMSLLTSCTDLMARYRDNS